jgi:hypothetical protein
MELVRTILLRAQDSEYARLRSEELVTEDWPEFVVAEHMRILREAGFIEASVTDYPEEVGAVRGRVLRLTWAGHEFIDAAANDTIWRKSLAFVKEKGGRGIYGRPRRNSEAAGRATFPNPNPVACSR